MAYCTPEDTAYLAERGFVLSQDGQAFNKWVGNIVYIIMPVWPAMKVNQLDTPDASMVVWVAQAGYGEGIGLVAVVSFHDQQPTPISAFVTAEIRGWKRENQ